jgi:hypothetical protein
LYLKNHKKKASAPVSRLVDAFVPASGQDGTPLCRRITSIEFVLKKFIYTEVLLYVKPRLSRTVHCQ